MFGLETLAAGALSIAGNYLSARQQQNAQMDLQKQQQKWQEKMSNTAHQREIADLQAAGLNPVLSGMGGQGASTPSGGMGEAQMADMGKSITDSINTATQAKSAEAQIKNLEANTAKQKQETAKTKSEKNLIDIQAQIEPQVANAKIRLDNAQSAKARQDIQESISREFANTISNKLKSMDLEKRQKNYWIELEIYQKELENQLIDAGFDQTTIGLILKSVGKTMGAASPFIEKHGGNTYNFTTSPQVVNY